MPGEMAQRLLRKLEKELPEVRSKHSPETASSQREGGLKGLFVQFLRKLKR